MARTKTSEVFSDEEKAAMKEAAAERKRQKAGADGEAELLAALAKMPPGDAEIGTRIHELVKELAPELRPKTWYGMPAWATPAGKVVLFFQSAEKFKYRYSTVGFQEDARLDEGDIWPASYAVLRLTPAVEKQLAALIVKAVG